MRLPDGSTSSRWESPYVIWFSGRLSVSESEESPPPSLSSSDEEEDPELEALLEQLSASSEDDDPDLSSPPMKQTQTARKARGVYEFPANNIAVLILACWTIRIPITFRDFTK